MTCSFLRKVVYVQRWPAHILILVYFQGPTHTHTSLFSQATCPRILIVVYFQGRPAHAYLLWSIFKGDLPTYSHTSLFSRATCPHILTLVYFQGDLPKHTHCGLFSGATCPNILIVVYFHGWPALLIGLTWDPICRSPLTRTKIGV